MIHLKAKDCAKMIISIEGESFYSYPCPIGACLSPADRARFDRFNTERKYKGIASIRDLAEAKEIIVDDIYWFSMIQNAYDTKNQYMFNYFLRTV